MKGCQHFFTLAPDRRKYMKRMKQVKTNVAVHILTIIEPSFRIHVPDESTAQYKVYSPKIVAKAYSPATTKSVVCSPYQDNVRRLLRSSQAKYRSKIAIVFIFPIVIPCYWHDIAFVNSTKDIYVWSNVRIMFLVLKRNNSYQRWYQRTTNSLSCIIWLLYSMGLRYRR